MPFVPAECTNCGAPLLVDDAKDAAICPYCNTPYVVEKAINKYNITNNITAQTVNIYGSESKDFEIRGGKLVSYKGESAEVVIPANVTVIGKGAFKDTAVKKVTVPKTVEDFEDYAFSGRIETLIFEEGRKSIPRVSKLKSLKKVVIPEGAEIISGFDGCKNLEDINIPSTVKEFGNRCFRECKSLKNISIPNGVKYIPESAFEGYEDVDNEFQYCSSIESVDIPKSVTAIGNNAFCGCISLKSINIPEGVTTIGDYAFSECKSLKSINIPESVTTIGNNAFNYCKSLKSINIPKSVTEIGNFAFWGCSSIESINIPQGVTSIGDSAFTYCQSLKSIEIPENVTTIGKEAFSNCSALESITFSNGVTSLGEKAFENCSALTFVHITDNIEVINKYAFENCASLTEIEFNQNLPEIYTKAFEGCESLKRAVFLTDDKSNLQYKRFKSNGHLCGIPYECEISFPNIETRQEYERREREKQQALWRSQGLCQHCGGSFRGLMFKNCMNCGKPKDY